MDDTIVVAGLLLMREMLWMSSYPEDVRDGLRRRIDILISNIQGRTVNVW